ADWTPIGTESKPFRGILDGGGHSISSLRYHGTDAEGAGLFGHAKGAEFRNLNLRSMLVEGTEIRDCGALVGRAEDCLFSGCSVEAEVRTGSSCAGGLVGRAVRSSFENCEATVYIEAGSPAGGLAGSVEFPEGSEPGYIRNCASYGTVYGSGEQGTGGLIGRLTAESVCEEKDGEYLYFSSGTTVEGCVSHANVAGTEGKSVSCAGGLIGSASCVDVSGCRAEGDVEGVGRCFGGLIGEFEGGVGSVSRCCAVGNVTDNAGSGDGYGSAFAGGLIGWSRGARISDCFATGDVYSGGIWSDCQDDWMASGGVWVRYRNPAGSLIGCLHFSYSDEQFYLTRCYATGTVAAPRVCEDEKSYCHGSLVGYVFDDLTRKYVIDKDKKDQTDLAGFEKTTVGCLDDNYCLSTLRTYYTPVSSYERKTTGYQARYVMPKISYVTNITEEEVGKQDTFGGFDFKTVWIMTENGPDLRGTYGPSEPGPEPALIGDVDGDGKVNAKDYGILKRYILRTLGSEPDPERKARMDVNKDGKWNSSDYVLLKRIVLGTYHPAG
ncbi:MAG: dockerin type I repeat-containing protein, partial [Clostridia bacterium]|nr:dockerin type I repeat-containing protein [Clostridia bacterium]